jgi:succinyl-CoA synthetase alpha subunit
VQGITGKIGRIQTRWMIDYGTNVVAGVTPGRGGTEVEGVPVFDSVAEALGETTPDASVFFVPPAFVKDAFFETTAAGIGLIVIVPEHVPVHDIMIMRAHLESCDTFALGPTTPGLLTPGQAKMGIMPGSLFRPGPVGIVSRSGTLAYEMAGILTEAGLGQSTVVGMGADPVVFSNLVEILKLFEQDRKTRAVVIVGEVGGVQEEQAAPFIAEGMSKPVAAYIAGRHAPKGKRMGHAGAIIRGTTGSVASKRDALQQAGVELIATPLAVVDWARTRGLVS